MLALAILIIVAGFVGAIVDRLLCLKQQTTLLTKEHFDMTVQQIKDRGQQGKAEIIAAGAAEATEVKALIVGGGGNAGGATQAQVDELGDVVNDLILTSVSTIQGISDNAQTPGGSGGGEPVG